MATVFQRMFGRRRSPVEGEENTDTGTEVTEERADLVNSDGFIVLDDTTGMSQGVYDPPPGYSVSGANAFLPYGLTPNAPSERYQRSSSTEIQTAIDGVPFKLGSNVYLQGDADSWDLSAVTEMITKINSFNWDDYEYNFQLEKSVLQEFSTTEEETAE